MNFVISIIKPDALDTLTSLCSRLTLPITMVMRGRGTASQNMLDLLGIESTEKRIVITVASPEKTNELIALQKSNIHIGVPEHGIVIAIPLKSIGGGKTLALLTGENKPTIHVPELNYAYELIIVICNEGYTDTVMNAARSAGVRGGTVLHAKGTGSSVEPKFHNISIALEKELIIIVSESRAKKEVMQTILKKAGPDTKAGAITFSLPISAVAGFGFPD